MNGVILMYHRVASAPEDAYRLSVSPSHFADHVDYLSGLGCVVPLGEMVKPGTALRVAITFDDGYVDNATAAAPLLASAGLPATYFITSGRLGAQHFWWDQLAVAVLSPSPECLGVDVSVGGRQLWLGLQSLEDRRNSLLFLHERLSRLPPDELASSVQSVARTLEAPAPPDRARTMTVEQLLEMSRLTGVDIGAHSRTHARLGSQSARVQENEVLGSVRDVSDILGHEVTAFAYPFGSLLEVGDLAPRLARQAGCSVACSTVPGPVDRRSAPHLLPRLNVQDWDAHELADHVAAVAAMA